MEQETELIKRGSIGEIVKAYESAMKKIDRAYAVLAEAEVELKSAFSVFCKHDTDFSVLPGRHGNTNESVTPECIKQAKEVIKRKAWRVLYQSLEIDRIASIKRRDEIQKQLEEGKFPDITVANVYDVFEVLIQNVNEFAGESVREVYTWLRPPSEYYEMTRYKTNQRNATYEVGGKVIKTNMVNNKYGGGFHVNYTNEKFLIALDKVFHMLDGKNIHETSYRSPLVDAINSSESGTVRTEYFFCRMFQNGNLHIEFLRKDLVKQFNAVNGGMNLKPKN